tara:strand:+ start:447 stop:848 length:402 start_codon:yes stop_codon:yes gene_type:complete
MADGFDFSDSDSFEAVFTYSAAQQTVPAQPSAPGWQVVGGFKPSANIDARIEFTGHLSVSGLGLTVRLFKIEGANSKQVGPLITTGSIVPVNIVSSESVQLSAGSIYQLQVQAIGGSGLDTEFAIINSIQLTI